MSTQAALPLDGGAGVAPIVAAPAPTTEATPAPAAAETKPAAEVKPATPAPDKAALEAAAAEKAAKDAAEAAKVEAAKTPTKLEVKLPEGVKVHETYIAEFTKALESIPGLNSEQASKLAELDIQRAHKLNADEVASWKARGEKWKQEIDSDPVLGGEKTKQSIAAVHRAIRQFGGKPTGPDKNELTDALAELGLEHHPVIFRTLHAIGAGLKEDTSAVAGGSAATGQVSESDRLRNLYPTMVGP